VRPEEAVFVGDTVWDVQACNEVGVPCIGLLSGGISREELRDAGAAEVYLGPGDLLETLADSILGTGRLLSARTAGAHVQRAARAQGDPGRDRGVPA
jgi:hypothetical protein